MLSPGHVYLTAQLLQKMLRANVCAFWLSCAVTAWARSCSHIHA